MKERFAGRIVPVDTEVAETWGRICGEAQRQGRALAVVDSLIAATALQHGMVVVTRNEADFAAAGAEVENPWT